MDELSIVLAKCLALQNTVESRISEKDRSGGTPRVFDPPTVREYFEQYQKLVGQLSSLLPALFSDLPDREIPQPKQSEVFDGRGYVPLAAMSTLVRDLDHISVVWDKTQSGNFAVPAMNVTREGVFFAGQYFDALERIKDILAQAKKSIVIIDGFVNEHVLSLVSTKEAAVEVNILTRSIPAILKTAALAFQKQYGQLSIRTSSVFHDRFVIVDDKDFYHVGASIKDLGNKGFMFSRIEEPIVISALLEEFLAEWDKANVII